MIKVLSLVLSLCFVSSNVSANVLSGKLKEYFERSGGSSNATKPSSYKNQAAGYYSGGSFYGRIPVEQVQPMSIQMPGFRMGCGGIDAWFGGFSHISSDQLVGALRKIGSSMGSYAFMIALETISPEIYNVMNELQAIAQKINSLNVNTCEAAATALGGMLPQSDATSKHLCQAMGTSMGGLSDWTSARHQCGAGGERHRILDKQHQDLQNTFKDEFNLVWQSLLKNDFLIHDKRLAEIFMTLAGTLIVKREGESYKTHHIRSHALDQKFIQKLLQGGAVEIQQCDEHDKCLNPTLRGGETLDQKTGALVGLVTHYLKTMTQKIYSDGKLTGAEISFLNNTNLPIYKILNVLTAYKKGQAPIEIESYAEVIALDILHHYILNVLDIVEESISQLRKAQMSDSAIREYLQSLQQVRSLIVQSRGAAMEHMNSTLSMIQSIQAIEKQLHVYVGTTLDEKWKEQL